MWVKPTKFAVSTAAFALTMGWFFGYVSVRARSSTTLKAVVVTIIATGSFEVIYIAWQAAHGLASHFNRTNIFFEVMYALMGIGAVLLVSTTLPLAWKIARWPADALPFDYVLAVVIGLLLCFALGGGFGVYMSQQSGHSVGLDRGHGLLFGWNRAGGDLRIAHFFGIHAQQAIPLLGLLLEKVSVNLRVPLLLGISFLYAMLTVGLFIQAIDGRALLPGWF